MHLLIILFKFQFTLPKSTLPGTSMRRPAGELQEYQGLTSSPCGGFRGRIAKKTISTAFYRFIKGHHISINSLLFYEKLWEKIGFF